MSVTLLMLFPAPYNESVGLGYLVKLQADQDQYWNSND